jgi:hypothetical protein
VALFVTKVVQSMHIEVNETLKYCYVSLKHYILEGFEPGSSGGRRQARFIFF